MDQEKFDYLKVLQKKIEQHGEGLRIGDRLVKIDLIVLDEKKIYRNEASLTSKKNNGLFKQIKRLLIDYSSSALLKYQKEFDEVK